MRSDPTPRRSPAAPPRVPQRLAKRSAEPASEPLGSVLRRSLASLALAAAVAGCATAHVRDPLTKTLGASTPEAQGEFWYQLANRPVASNDEAFHALLLYLDGTDASATYDGRVRALANRHMLPKRFDGGADDAVDRGTMAVALDQMLHVRGGLTMQLFGPSPRYALRAAVEKGIFPPSSPNQGLSGGELVGVMQRAEELQRGDPSEGPASLLPDQVHPAEPAPVAAAAEPGTRPLYLDDVLAQNAPPTSAPAGATGGAGQPAHLKAFVTGVQGKLVEIRPSPTAAWKPAHVGMTLTEGTEIRTGPKCAIKFLIPSEEAFCLDSQGSVTLAAATMELKKARTRIDLDRGRLREDLSHAAPVRIDEAGVEHDTVIRSPNSALALRGTKVSLFEQASFEPVAVSLTGTALFTNTQGMRVAFGDGVRRHVVIVGSQTSAAQQADAQSSYLNTTGNTASLNFASRELAIVSQRGGFQRGDVLVGDLHLDDFGTRPDGTLKVPGGLDFVLQWSGATKTTLSDLNLAVFSPQNTTASPDFVANPPFTVSLTPNSPKSVQLRRTLYPEQSRTGGRISTNSVGPDGLELAFWPKNTPKYNYPTGNYVVVVYDLVDAFQKPTATVQPVTYTVTVVRNGQNLGSYTDTIGLLQTSKGHVISVPATTSATATATTTTPLARRTVPKATPAPKPRSAAVPTHRQPAR